MTFNQIILKRLAFIFEKYNLNIIEQRNYYVSVQTINLEMAFVYNQLENSFNFFISKKNKKNSSIEINNALLKSFFNSDLKLSEVSFDTFVNNLILFFENEGKFLLEDDLKMIDLLEKFSSESAKIYTQNLLKKQILVSADIAWDKGNYKEFVNLINQINKVELTTSYQLKYKIASQKLKV